jgi:hypothetical protein
VISNCFLKFVSFLAFLDLNRILNSYPDSQTQLNPDPDLVHWFIDNFCVDFVSEQRSQARWGRSCAPSLEETGKTLCFLMTYSGPLVDPICPCTEQYPSTVQVKTKFGTCRKCPCYKYWCDYPCKMDKFYDLSKFDWFSRVLKTISWFKFTKDFRSDHLVPYFTIRYLVVPQCDWPKLVSVDRRSRYRCRTYAFHTVREAKNYVLYSLFPTGMVAPIFHFHGTEFLGTAHFYPHRNIAFYVLEITESRIQLHLVCYPLS